MVGAFFEIGVDACVGWSLRLHDPRRFNFWLFQAPAAPEMAPRAFHWKLLLECNQYCNMLRISFFTRTCKKTNSQHLRSQAAPSRSPGLPVSPAAQKRSLYEPGRQVFTRTGTWAARETEGHGHIRAHHMRALMIREIIPGPPPSW